MKARLFRRWGGILLALSTLLLQLPAQAEEPVLDTVRFSWVAGNENAKTFNFTGTTGRFVIDWGDGGKDMLTLTKEEERTVKHQYKNEEGEYSVMLSALNQDNANPRIERLNVGQKGLTSLDVSGCTSLTSLSCSGNLLTELDVSKNTALTSLGCGNNQLTSLDASGCTSLTSLGCSGNLLTELDVSKNTALTYLNCYGNQLKRLNVNGCTRLSSLECYNNQLTELDMSGCTALSTLKCYDNRLTELNVSTCTKLNTLNCYNNQLTNLDVSTCSLGYLECYNNQLTDLNLNESRSLETLICNNNQLTKLKVYSNSRSLSLNCAHNLLTELDLSGSFIIKNLLCSDNQLTGVDLRAGYYHSRLENEYWTTVLNFNNNYRMVQLNEDRSFDLSTLPNMDTADIHDLSGGHREGNILYFDADVVSYSYVNHLRGAYHEAGICNGFHLVAERKEKTCDTVRFNWMVEVGQEKTFGFDGIGDGLFLVDWGDGSRPDTLTGKGSGKYSYTAAHEYTEGKNYTVLLCGMETTVRLMKLSNSNNDLTSLDVSGCTALEDLYCGDNPLTELDVSKNTALCYLYCYNNRLTELNVDSCKRLTYLECYNNRLTELNVDSCKRLTYLECYNNRLTELDVSGCTALRTLDCYNNQLTELDISSCIALEGLGCSNNQLTELDVSSCIALEGLNCHNNQLTELNVSGCTALESLNCHNNRLTKLDVKLTNMVRGAHYYSLICSHNQLTKLNVSGFLPILDCSHNQLLGVDLSETFVSGGYTRNYSFSNNFRIVQVNEDRSFDLSTLFPDLDVSKMGSVTGGHIEGCILHFDADVVNYSYDVNNSEIYINRFKDGFHLVASHSGENLDTVRFDWTAEAGQEKTFGFDGIGDGRFLVDWGDGSRPDTLPGNGRHEVKHEYTEGKSHTVLLCGLQGTERLLGLNLTHKNLTGLDVSGCLLLLELYCDSNQLAALDVSRNTFLTSLNCSYNQLTDLDVSACSALEDLNCSHNRLKNFGDCMFTELKRVDCSYNRIPLSFLCWYEYKMSSLHDNYWFSDWEQSDSITVSVGEKWDLSSERIIGSATSTYRIYYDYPWGPEIPPKDYTENNFVFRFNKPGDYKLVICNDNTTSFTWYVSVEKGTEFTVRVSPNNIYYGTATITGNGTYTEGTDVTITATPKQGYRFVNWIKKDGSVFATEAVHTFTVTENLELTANFEKSGVGNESAVQAGIRVYPNPNSGIFHIDLPEAALLEVFTSNGTLVLREQAAAGIKTMHLESGSYLLHITSNGNTTTKRVVVL